MLETLWINWRIYSMRASAEALHSPHYIYLTIGQISKKAGNSEFVVFQGLCVVVVIPPPPAIRRMAPVLFSTHRLHLLN